MTQTKRQRKRLEWVRFLDKNFSMKSSRQMVKEAEARDRRIEKRKSKV